MVDTVRVTQQFAEALVDPTIQRRVRVTQQFAEVLLDVPAPQPPVTTTGRQARTVVIVQ